MAQPERQRVPLLLRPDLIEEVNRMGAHLRSPEGQAEVAAWAKRLREDPVEQRLNRELDADLTDVPGWEWNEDL